MNHHFFSRRQFLKASGAVISIGALAACAMPTPGGGAEGGAGATQEGITLQFATQYPEPPMNAGDDQIIDKFKAENADITVEKMTWPGQDFHDKLRLLATAGDLPGTPVPTTAAPSVPTLIAVPDAPADDQPVVAGTRSA